MILKLPIMDRCISYCGTVNHYPIYGDRPLIGRSNLLYACKNNSFALSSASHWHRRARKYFLVLVKKTIWWHILLLKWTKVLARAGYTPTRPAMPAARGNERMLCTSHDVRTYSFVCLWITPTLNLTFRSSLMVNSSLIFIWTISNIFPLYCWLTI